MFMPSPTSIGALDLSCRPPRPHRNGFLSRCETLLADWSALAGTSNAIVDAFRTATLRLDHIANAGTRRSWLGAARNGAPVELCESIAATTCGPRFFCDPSPSAAIERAHAFLRNTALEPDKLDNLARTAHALQSTQHAAVFWLGAEAATAHGALTRTVYVDKLLTPPGTASARAAQALLRSVQIKPTFDARRSLALVAHQARLRMFECEVRPDGRIAANLSFCRPLDTEIVTLAAACGVPGQPFAQYLDRLLRLRQDGADRRAVTTLRIGPSGDVSGVSVSHYAAPHFSSDADLRAAVLANAHAFQWQSAPYRTASRSNGETNDGSRARCYLRFGVQRGGAARLDIFTSPGRLLTDDAHAHRDAPLADRGDFYVDLV